MGYNCRVPRVKPHLNLSQRRKRLHWAKEKKDWTVGQWSKVLFSDESKVCLSFGNQGPRVWRKTEGTRELNITHVPGFRQFDSGNYPDPKLTDQLAADLQHETDRNGALSPSLQELQWSLNEPQEWLGHASCCTTWPWCGKCHLMTLGRRRLRKRCSRRNKMVRMLTVGYKRVSPLGATLHKII
ncbi:hypothetical protein SKAU_G00279330 [Synaphobranchus kaupii]|uniref:Transposase Tc1-like domain-containing protein n=1 Tax=Synaphobranchus kaupii TaxID=118154 RepID=A0A9Q1EWT6_SYNKA|nr:hypothetical protein SKAU_G00279330 [Synaphobranchus kaupii]